MTSIRIAGTDYPAALTVDAAVSLIKTYGDIKSALTVLQSRDVQDALIGSMDIVAVLIAGGAAHLKLTTGESCKTISGEEIRVGAYPSEVPEIRGAAISAMMEGLHRDIEAEGDKKKEKADG